jgi:signal transduction histidine kinase
MKVAFSALTEQYVSALRDYIHGGGEEALQRAYELGRKALTEGLGVLDMASVHHQALMAVLEGQRTLEEHQRAVKAAEDFLVECLSPFEMTHRGFREANVALRSLNERLEAEARRIAHALHDEASQLLASVHLVVDEVSCSLPSDQARDRLLKIKGILDQIEGQIRHLSHELRPTVLDDLGLIPALEFLAQGVSTRSGLHITVEGKEEQRLPPTIEITLYRITQEALTNAFRHARAKRVRIQIRRTNQSMECSIRDDGIGFDAVAIQARKGDRGLGLMGIRERLNALGGSLSITSGQGNGTELLVTLPLEACDAPQHSPRG